MKETKPKILLFVWVVWLVTRVIHFILYPIPLTPALGELLIPAICCGLGWQLYQNPNRKLTVRFSVACLFMFIKFCAGPISYYWSFTHSFQNGVLKWWTHGFSGVLPFTDSIGATILIIYTFYYWPLFCFKQRDLKDDKPEA